MLRQENEEKRAMKKQSEIAKQAMLVDEMNMEIDNENQIIGISNDRGHKRKACQIVDELDEITSECDVSAEEVLDDTLDDASDSEFNDLYIGNDKPGSYSEPFWKIVLMSK